MECPIHYETIDREAIASLRCGHVFCHSCILRWLVQELKGECPLCKKPATKNDISRLYVNFRLPGSPTKKTEGPGQLSAEEKCRGQRILGDLERATPEVTKKNAGMVREDMDQFSDAIASTSGDIEAKRLAEDIKFAVYHIQDVVLQNLEALTKQLEDTRQENARLVEKLRRKMLKIEDQRSDIITFSDNITTLQRAKNFADDNCSAVRQKLEIAEAKLIDTEAVIRAKDQEIGEKEEYLDKYRRWLGLSKVKVEELKQKIEQLKSSLAKQPPPPESAAVTLRDNSQSQDGQKSMWVQAEPKNAGRQVLGRSPKRLRIEDEENSGDVKLDKSCFIRKPKASFQISKNESAINAQNIPGLKTSNGKVKGLVSTGRKLRPPAYK